MIIHVVRMFESDANKIWVLVNAVLIGGSQPGGVKLCAESSTCQYDGIFLPVLPNGRIHELAQIPAKVLDANPVLVAPDNKIISDSSIRAVSRFERTWRMANRVFDCFIRLSRNQRLSLGLTIWRAIFDLPLAYSYASALRWSVDYQSWLARFDLLRETDFTAIGRHLEFFSIKPHFSVVVFDDGCVADDIALTVASVERQLYRNFTCTVSSSNRFNATASEIGATLRTAGEISASNVLQDESTARNDGDASDWLLFLRPGDCLPPHALYWFACGITAEPDAVVFYSDDDATDSFGVRSRPRFKPAWSESHFRATDFIGNALILRNKEVVAAGGISVDVLHYGTYDLVLRILDMMAQDTATPVVHIPAVLLHCSPNPLPEGLAAWQRTSVESHLKRNHVTAEADDFQTGFRRIRYTLPALLPLVSIIIPTKDALGLIRQCIESLLEKTSYRSFEILVIDNQSRDPAALAYLSSIDGRQKDGNAVRVLKYDFPFNYSAINNFAVQHAKGELLCLLNNDTEVISPDWLDEMVGHLLQPGVAAVGAKLFYPDGRVQHAGDVVGPGGCANHLHSMIAKDDPGYCNRAIVAQELSAVTAACLLTLKKVYCEVGGLDARFLRVAFNDVDYCLKLRKAGYKVVWTPHAELFHHESVSRGKDRGWRKVLRAELEVFVMRQRWKREMKNDPFYNPNLSYVRPDFSMSHVRRVSPPWAAFEKNKG